MALRVLLADESTSIKKVMQLALQDFGVEVKAVPIGLDVIPVARSWHPDIIFVDVLLAKKSGYDVCSELKADSVLSLIPTVLIWSSFMDIDERRATACGATRRLEKPFDADTLRGLIKDLVPDTQSNAISNYLTFPKLPEFVEKPSLPKAPTPEVPKFSKPVTAPFTPEPPHVQMSEVDEPEDFRQVPLPRVTPSVPQRPAPFVAKTAGSFAGNLERFKINLPTEEFENLETDYASLDEAPIALTGAVNDVALGELEDLAKPTETAKPTAPAANLDPAYVEQILREQVRHVLQDIAWKIVPDIAERIVREEIQKLLKDAEKLA